MNRRLAISVGVLALLLAIVGWLYWPGHPSTKRVSRRPSAAATRQHLENRDAGDPLHSPMFAPRPAEPPSDEDLELLAQVQADDRYNLVCRLSEAVPSPMTVKFWDEKDNGGVALLIGDQAFLMVAAGDGAAILKAPELASVALSWTGAGETTRGICSPDPLVLAVIERATASGFVTNAGDHELGDVTVEGCGSRTIVEEDGYFLLDAYAGDCQVQALRRDGVFYARSTPVSVHLEAGQDTRVDLTIPARRTAGLGVQIGKGDGGIAVMNVIPGGAAVEAGLQQGDVIIGLDGEPLTDVSLEEFQRRALGEAGTKVSLVVRDPEGRQRDVTLDRRTID